MTEPFRPLSEYELSLIQPLYAIALERGSVDEVDLKSGRVRPFPDEDGYGSLEFEGFDESHTWTSTIVAEARGFDEDGVPIDYILHVKDRLPSELDVVKADGTPIKLFPTADEIDWSQVR